jgi:hypothetical protein
LYNCGLDEGDLLIRARGPIYSAIFVKSDRSNSKSEEAINNGEKVIEMYLEAWQEDNQPIPKPMTLQIA